MCAIAGCAPPAEAPAGEPAAPAVMDYDRTASWLCRPDLPDDACRGDRDATEVLPDGRRVVVPFVPAADPAIDCFYVYPTVDLGMVPGNHTDFSDTASIREMAFAQIARFGATCRVFAPLYQQMTFGTYFGHADDHERRFAIAYADVLASFRWYLAHAGGRRFALVGHSQGAQMIERLLGDPFEDDPALRARLVVAMPIGGDVNVAEGSTAGGTFRNLPLCTRDDETGCVIAFGTVPPRAVRHPWPGPAPAGRRNACVNPGEGDGEKRTLSLAVFPSRSKFHMMPGSDWATTPFVAYPDFYAAWCADGADGFRFLEVDEARAPGDARTGPVDSDHPALALQAGNAPPRHAARAGRPPATPRRQGRRARGTLI